MTEAVGLGKHTGTKLDDDLWLDDHLFEIREKIVVRAKELLADANNQLTKAAALSKKKPGTSSRAFLHISFEKLALLRRH